MEQIIRIKEKLKLKNIQTQLPILKEQIELFERQYNVNLPKELVLEVNL